MAVFVNNYLDHSKHSKIDYSDCKKKYRTRTAVEVMHGTTDRRRALQGRNASYKEVYYGGNSEEVTGFNI